MPSTQIVRAEARIMYKKKYKMVCVHCGNKNIHNMQICHIEPVAKFKPFYRRANFPKNLIALCANCHLDYDKAKKLGVCRTVLLHQFLIQHSEYIKWHTNSIEYPFDSIECFMDPECVKREHEYFEISQKKRLNRIMFKKELKYYNINGRIQL